VNVLDLLDGTIRLGRPLVVSPVELWPDNNAVAGYVDGGRYAYDGAWTLELTTTPFGGLGQSATWSQLTATWQWQQFDAGIGWLDLVGVGP
jgi:hypothetical protein